MVFCYRTFGCNMEVFPTSSLSNWFSMYFGSNVSGSWLEYNDGMNLFTRPAVSFTNQSETLIVFAPIESSIRYRSSHSVLQGAASWVTLWVCSFLVVSLVLDTKFDPHFFYNSIIMSSHREL